MTMLIALLATAGASPRIVNGTDAAPGEYPNVVLLQIEGASGNGSCTGSLIHERWILTAAHCFDSVSLAQNPSGNATVVFGNSVGTATTTVASSRAFVHPQYVALPDPDGGTTMNGLGPWPEVPGYDIMTNDIALIELATPVSLTPMALNSAPIDNTWIGRDILNIGYGITAFGGSDSGTKRYANVPLTRFREAWPDGNGSIDMQDVEDGRSTCQGDSGGPGVYVTGDTYVQVGITSYGIECGTSVSTSMRVDLYIDWIEETSGITVLTSAVRPPTFLCSHQINDSATSIALGTVPMNLQCIISSGDPETIETITWFWGDGSPSEELPGDEIATSHVYDTMGVYNLRACVAGTRGTEERPAPYEDCILKTNHVNACDVPEARFEATPLDGLKIDVKNTTSLRAHNCVSNARWEVFQGASATGEPLLSLSGWEPDLNLEEYGAGDYTVVLNVGGLGGTGAASAVVPVGRGNGCSTVGAPTLAGMLALPFLALLRRRV